MPTNSTVPTSFDPYDEDSWFFGYMSRKDAADTLLADNEVGAFLVRESTTAKGDLVLSVKENNDKISHYIINRISSEKGSQANQVRFKIGDHIFSDLPNLLAFYKSNNLDDTPLKVPAFCKSSSIAHKRSFTKDYLAEIQSDARTIKSNNQTVDHVGTTVQRKLPSKAQVIQTRIPNAYDRTALTLKEGQILKVTKTDINGCWEGELDGRVGHFPFNYVKFIEE